MRKKLLLLLILVLMILHACGGPEPELQESPEGDAATESGSCNLTWASGAQGGGWYSMAGGISSLIQENNSDINIRTIPGGSMQNMPFISNNEAQLAWMQPPFIIAGLDGEEPFEEPHDNVSTIGNGFGTNHFHFIVGEDTGIESIDEIFDNEMGVNIAVTPVNNSDEWVFRRFLEYYDVTYEDIESWGGSIFHNSYQEQVDAFSNGNVDVIFTQLAIPASSVTEAGVSRDMRILPMDEDMMEYLTDFGLEINEIPADTYPEAVNGDEAIPTASMGNVLTVNSEVDEETVYEITKIINENVERLPNIHSSLNDYDVDNAVDNLLTDLHPGAERYYQEIGILD